MRHIRLLLFLVVGANAAVSDNPFKSSPQLPDSLVQEVCGCWEKTLFMDGKVRELSVEISTALANRAIEINITLSEYNDNILFVKLISYPISSDDSWSSLWMDSAGNLQPSHIEFKKMIIYAMAELPETTERIYIFRQMDETLRLVVRTERDGIGTFTVKERLGPCTDVVE